MLNQTKHFKLLGYLLIIIDLIFINLLVMNYLDRLSAFWNLTIIFFFVLALNTLFLIWKIKRIPENERESSSLIYFSSHIFLLGLVVIVLNQFLQRQFIIDFMPEISGVIVALGVLTFYANRKDAEEKFENKKEIEEIMEKKKKEEFSDKFPRISKIPIFNSFVKWMYKEGWAYSIGLILIIMLGVILLFWNLGYAEFMNDEFATMEASTSQFYEGTNWKWDWVRNESGEFTKCIEEDKWCDYRRAESHSWLISRSYSLFGISEFSARLISAIFGLILFVAVYPVTKSVTKSKKYSLLFTLAVVLHPKMVELFRYARMYALLIPIFFVLVYLTHYLIKEKEKLIKNKLNLLGLLTLIILLFIWAYNLHPQTLFILPPTLLYLIYHSAIYKEKVMGKIYLLVAIVFAISVMFFWSSISSFEGATKFINLGERINTEYMGLAFDYPIGIASMLIAMSFFIFLILTKNKTKTFYIYLSLIVATSLFSLIYLIDRFSHQVYISNLFPLILFVVTFPIYYFAEMPGNKNIKFVMYAILLIFIFSNFYQSTGIIYEEDNTYFAKYSEAYQPIIERYNAQEDAIFLGYSRKYYLKDLDYRGGAIHEFGNKDYSEETENMFKKQIAEYESGWITWDSYAEGDIKTSTRKYIEENFVQVSGNGIDDTNVNVYYFNRDTMLKSS